MIFDPNRVADYQQWKMPDLWERLFYKPRDGGNGFDFVMIEVVSLSPTDSDPNCDRDPFEDKPDGLEIEILFHGVALFDGVRHLYFGHEESENYGYLNYPDVGNIALLLSNIRDLEIKYCNYPHWRKEPSE